jgi:hypothetical protein
MSDSLVGQCAIVLRDAIILANKIMLICEVVTAVNTKGIISWDVTPCNPVEVYRRFGGTYCLQL